MLKNRHGSLRMKLRNGMKSVFVILATILVVGLMMPTAVMADVFQTDVQRISAPNFDENVSGRALAMGTAVTSNVSDATAVWINPAALAWIKDNHIMLTGGSHEDNTFYPSSHDDGIAASFMYDSVAESMMFTGIYYADTNFGVSFNYPVHETVTQDVLALDPSDSNTYWTTLEQNNRIKCITAAYGGDLADNFAAGIAVNWYMYDYDIHESYGHGFSDESEADVGITVGALYKFTNDRQLSLVYRSQVENIFALDGFADERFWIGAPARLTAGYSHQFTADLMMAFELEGEFWNTLDDTLEDRFNYRLGGEYILKRRNKATWPLRMGLYNNSHPQGELNFEEEAIFTAGLGYDHERWGLDFGAAIGQETQKWLLTGRVDLR